MSDSSRGKFQFGTKAETLSRLHGQLKYSTIFEPYYFTASEWSNKQQFIIESINLTFKKSKLIVRSSALNEDGGQRSMAGAYDSILNVDGSDEEEVIRAINSVLLQYDENPSHQVLIQKMLSDVILSGVIMTRDLSHGGPYIVINYDDESGKTDTVTSGTMINKTVSIFRDNGKSHIRSNRIKSLVEMAEELENFCDNVPLDIEFGYTKSGELYVFQVRQITTIEKWRLDYDSELSERLCNTEKLIAERSKTRPGLVGSRTVFGVMPDWNPAELLGPIPGPLSISLFRKLITRGTWREARQMMGYRAMPPEELTVVIEGQPFIDVRCSFNSFLPEGLDDKIAHKLIDAWISRLSEHPELHDKVEFEIADTVLYFDFHQQFLKRYKNLLDPHEFNTFYHSLRRLTIRAIDTSDSGSLRQAELQIKKLAQLQTFRHIELVGSKNETSPLHLVTSLLDECKKLGTTPFSMMARHAFIAEALIQSSVRVGVFTVERVAQFKRTIHTILSDMTSALDQTLKGTASHSKFLASYGHLRPGTFDIRSPRYFDRLELFTDSPSLSRDPNNEKFIMTRRERQALNDLLLDIGLTNINADDFLDYVKRSISGREYAKFIFSRNLSDALEWIALWGARRHINREQLANLDLKVILDTLTNPSDKNESKHLIKLSDREERQKKVRRLMRLSALIRDKSDIYVVPMLRNEPNFVTNQQVNGQIMSIKTTSGSELKLNKKVACIESADPGFDWIFNKGITGLITKYGGVNSHMAIRCAEIGLPAAIGCGEQLYDRIISAGAVEIDGREKILRPIYDRRNPSNT